MCTCGTRKRSCTGFFHCVVALNSREAVAFSGVVALDSREVSASDGIVAQDCRQVSASSRVVALDSSEVRLLLGLWHWTAVRYGFF